MPIAVTFNQRKREVVARASGLLTADELASFVRMVRAPVDFRDWPLLFDARGARTLETEDAADALARQVMAAAAREGGVRNYAALVADDDAVFALFLAYETRLMLEGFPVVRVFRKKGDAEQWLRTMVSARRFGPMAR